MPGGLSSAEIEREFPYFSRIILRTPWLTHEQLCLNQVVSDLANRHHCGTFNEICRLMPMGAGLGSEPICTKKPLPK